MGGHDFAVRGSRTLYTGRVLAVRADEVQMPGGRVATREVLEHPGAVAVAAVDGQRRLVLIHQYRHAVGRRLFELPAGLLDEAGEEPLVTARRELVEEAGLAAEHWAVLLDVVPSPGFSDEAVRVYLATGLSEQDRPSLADDEESDLVVHRLPLNEAVRRVLAGEIVNAVSAAGVLAAHAVVDGFAEARPTGAPWPDRPHRFAARSVNPGGR